MFRNFPTEKRCTLISIFFSIKLKLCMCEALDGGGGSQNFLKHKCLSKKTYVQNFKQQFTLSSKRTVSLRTVSIAYLNLASKYTLSIYFEMSGTLICSPSTNPIAIPISIGLLINHTIRNLLR